MAVILYSRVILCEFIHHCSGAVIGGVIVNADLKVSIRLVKHTTDCSLQELRSAIGRNNGRDLRHAYGTFLSYEGESPVRGRSLSSGSIRPRGCIKTPHTSSPST